MLNKKRNMATDTSRVGGVLAVQHTIDTLRMGSWQSSYYNRYIKGGVLAVQLL